MRPRKGPSPGDVYRGFLILGYLPDRLGKVVEATCPKGHQCVSFLRGMGCQSCLHATQERYQRPVPRPVSNWERAYQHAKGAA